MNQIDCKQAQNVWSRVMAAQQISTTSNSMQWYRPEATSGSNTPSFNVVSRVFTRPGSGTLLNSSSTFLRVLIYFAMRTETLEPFSTLWLTLPR